MDLIAKMQSMSRFAKCWKSKESINKCVFTGGQMGRQTWKPGNMLYPLPVVMVSCQRPGEKPNIITIAWAGTICSDPACLSISVRRERHSYDIIKETGEFVVNLTTKEFAFATDYCGVKSGRDIDKFKECKLTPLKSNVVNARELQNLRCV